MADASRIDEVIQRNAEAIATALEQHMLASFTPDARKELRSFAAGEVSEFLGIETSRLRKLHFENKIPDVPPDARKRRHYRAEDILAIREVLEKSSKVPGKYLPGRREGDKIQVITIANFKGGSGKSTTAINLAHRLSLRGYRVLACDIDAQASLTGMFGYTPEAEFHYGGTIYDAIRYNDPVPMQDIIRKTYFPNLSLAPAGLVLAEFEHETPRALQERQEPMFFQRLGMAIDQVQDQFDVVLIDCAPQLGFLTMSALIAATTIIVTVVPAMLDIASMSQFLQMTSGMLNVIAKHGASLEYDNLKYLITRFEPSDGPQAQMAAFLRTLFGDQVMTNPFLKSTAIADAGLTQQTIYEVDRSLFSRSTYDRAIESANQVAGEVEGLLQAAWGRH